MKKKPRRLRYLVTLVVGLAGVAHAQDGGVKLPLLLEGKLDAWEQPLVTADKLVIRKLLREKKYAQLTQLLEALQAVSDGDCAKELVGIDAFDALATTEKDLTAPFDGWLLAFPEHWVARRSRGLRREHLAWAARGSATIDRTSDAQLTKMRALAKLAREDLEFSIERHPTLSAFRSLISLAQLTGELDGEAPLARGRKLCPASFQLHARVMPALAPKWGGSFEAMQAFAADAPVERNPKLALLAGFVHLEQCTRDDLGACERAIAVGPYWDFLGEAAWALLVAHRPAEALKLLDRALEQRPQKARLHAMRAVALDYLMREREANKERAAATAIDASDFFLN